MYSGGGVNYTVKMLLPQGLKRVPSKYSNDSFIPSRKGRIGKLGDAGARANRCAKNG